MTETRVIVLMEPKLRDQIKAIGKSEGRVLMRQIEHICKEFVASRRKPKSNP